MTQDDMAPAGGCRGRGQNSFPRGRQASALESPAARLSPLPQTLLGLNPLLRPTGSFPEKMEPGKKEVLCTID